MLLNCVVLDKSPESPLDFKEIKSINPKGNQPWIFIGRTDDEAPIWPSEAKSQLIGKDPDAGENRRQEEEGSTEDEIDGWHHWLNEEESEQAPGDGEGQGSLACCSPWGCKESDTTEQLNKSQFNFETREQPLYLLRRWKGMINWKFSPYMVPGL